MTLVFKELKGHEMGIWEAQVLALARSPKYLCDLESPIQRFWASQTLLSKWAHWVVLIATGRLQCCSSERDFGPALQEKESGFKEPCLWWGHDFIQDVYLPDPLPNSLPPLPQGNWQHSVTHVVSQFELIEFQAKSKAASCRDLGSLIHKVDAVCVVIKKSSGSGGQVPVPA